jgi:hypothetical protein
MFKSARKFPIAAHIAGPAIVLCSLPGLASAQDATWLLAPGTPDFNTSTNWNPVAPPAGPTGTATFDASSATTISFSQATSVGTFFFNAGALSYTFNPSTTLTITGGGIEGATAANAPTFNSGFPGIDFQAGTAGPAVFNNHR